MTHISEQDAVSDKALEEAYRWYILGPRQRLQHWRCNSNGCDRWNKKDLTGRLIKKVAQERADQ